MAEIKPPVGIDPTTPIERGTTSGVNTINEVPAGLAKEITQSENVYYNITQPASFPGQKVITAVDPDSGRSFQLKIDMDANEKPTKIHAWVEV